MSQKARPNKPAHFTLGDQIILSLDRGLRTLFGSVTADRPNPAGALPEAALNPAEKAHAAGLMRVNHTGEVCAQALYEGQALIARKPAVRDLLMNAAREEADHLVWCQHRLKELDSNPSVLNPAFYAASWVLGIVTGAMGDRNSLGFVEATEHQVSAHLSEHLSSLPDTDVRSRAIVAAMQAEEAEHGENALRAGGQPFRWSTRALMRLLSRVMTMTTYRL